MEIIEKSYSPAVITINYEEAKAALTEKLKEYKGLVVTDETLQTSKAAQKELAGFRNNIDSYRKEKKKGLEEPIKVFEQQCKELIALVQDAEAPLKNAIQYYDDAKREEKRKQAEQYIKEFIDIKGLYGKYADQFTVLDKYLNLTATKKSVIEDIQSRGLVLLEQQKAAEERINTIRAVIESENARIKNELAITDFSYLINTNAELSLIIGEIKKRAESIYVAENTPKGEAKSEELKEEKPPVNEAATEIKEEKPVEQFTATFKVIGSADELRAVSNFLKQNNIAYEVVEQFKL